MWAALADAKTSKISVCGLIKLQSSDHMLNLGRCKVFVYNTLCNTVYIVSKF